MTGWSDGTAAYNGTYTTGDFARGNTGVAVTTGGLYNYTGGTGPGLYFQPATSDFTPGTLTLKVWNNGTSLINQIAVSYNLFVRNDQDRSNSFNFSYSSDNITYTDVPALDYASPAAQTGSTLSAAIPRSTTITGLNIPMGSYFYIRWSSNDVGGSGSRDEFMLDDIMVTATYPGACTPPATNASFTGQTNTLATQLQVNYTTGSGGEYSL